MEQRIDKGVPWTFMNFIWKFFVKSKRERERERERRSQQQENTSKPKNPAPKENWCHTLGRVRFFFTELFWQPPKNCEQRDPISLFTPWKFNSSPLRIYHPKRRRIVFQPSFLKGYLKLWGCRVSFIRGAFNNEKHMMFPRPGALPIILFCRAMKGGWWSIPSVMDVTNTIFVWIPVLHGEVKWYCWWKNSCTTWDV